MREECRTLPRVTKGLADVEKWLEQLRIVSGVTDVEKQTVEAQELGTHLPAGTAPVRISPFPTPMRVINQLTDPDRKRMLSRFYPEYQFLCGFVHFSPATVTLTSLLDSRQPFRKLFTSGQITEMWQKEIAGPAMWLSVISAIQCCTEFLAIYPNDVELARCCVEAWKPLQREYLYRPRHLGTEKPKAPRGLSPIAMAGGWRTRRLGPPAHAGARPLDYGCD